MRPEPPRPSIYQRVYQHNGQVFDLCTPRWMHAMEGRVMRGCPFDVHSLAVSNDQVIIPEAAIKRIVALAWDGSALVEHPEAVAWSEH